MKLFYDTETTGLANDRMPLDHPSQPHLVELGLKLTDDTGALVQCVSLIVKPDGWTIPEQAAKVHGITTEVALKYGIPHALVVATWTNLRAVADELIAHNEAFDDKIMRIAVARTGKTPAHPGPSLRTCTVILAAPIVNLPPTARMIATGFGHKPKAPNLTECVRFFFDEEFVGAHRALTDVEQCSRVYFEILRRRAAAADAPGGPTYDLDHFKTADADRSAPEPIPAGAPT